MRTKTGLGTQPEYNTQVYVILLFTANGVIFIVPSSALWRSHIEVIKISAHAGLCLHWVKCFAYGLTQLGSSLMLEMPVAAQQRFPRPMGERRQATVFWLERGSGKTTRVKEKWSLGMRTNQNLTMTQEHDWR